MQQKLNKMQKRKNELTEIAIDRCLDCINFDVYEYFDDDEKLEYEKLSYKLGESEYNPDKK